MTCRRLVDKVVRFSKNRNLQEKYLRDLTEISEITGNLGVFLGIIGGGIRSFKETLEYYDICESKYPPKDRLRYPRSDIGKTTCLAIYTCVGGVFGGFVGGILGTLAPTVALLTIPLSPVILVSLYAVKTRTPKEYIEERRVYGLTINSPTENE